MNHGSASEIQGGKSSSESGIQQSPLAPNHVSHRVIDEDGPQNGKGHHGTELHALGKSSRDQARGNDGEHQLVHHESLGRNGGGVIAVRRGTYAVQEQIVEAANEAIACAETEAVAK